MTNWQLLEVLRYDTKWRTFLGSPTEQILKNSYILLNPLPWRLSWNYHICKVADFLFFLILSYFSISLFCLFSGNEKHEHHLFHLFPVHAMAFVPQIYVKFNLMVPNLQKGILNCIQNPMRSTVPLCLWVYIFALSEGFKPLHFSCNTE